MRNLDQSNSVDSTNIYLALNFILVLENIYVAQLGDFLSGFFTDQKMGFKIIVWPGRVANPK